jgi:hypothetical protein
LEDDLVSLVEDFEETIRRFKAGEIEAPEPAIAIKRGRGRPRKVFNPKTLRVPVESDVLDRFNEKCKREGVSSADKIREFVADYADVR